MAAEPLPGTAMTTVAKPNQPGVLQTTQLTVTGGMASNTKTVDCLVIGSGPASLGLMVAAAFFGVISSGLVKYSIAIGVAAVVSSIYNLNPAILAGMAYFFLN